MGKNKKSFSHGFHNKTIDNADGFLFIQLLLHLHLFACIFS